ncbi:MAG: LysM peptidoglycan-binding domain-containing protein [Catalinimonas sp.]
MIRLALFCGLFGVFLTAAAQPTEVEMPARIRFADVELQLTAGARKKVRASAEALRRSPKFFNLKVDKADAYFPIIDRVFRAEGVPFDFRYLVLQESGLVPDAVSSSNAVGYWQFKKVSAQEVGLRVDGQVDERMNIVSATRGAARYLKRNNQQFDNWMIALLSYNMGMTGAKNFSNARDFGKRQMQISEHSHWYILKFLAHKLAFEDYVLKNPNPPLRIVEVRDGEDKTLRQIADETRLSYDEVEAYNKWLKGRRIPSDRPYVVTLPVRTDSGSPLLALLDDPEAPSGRASRPAPRPAKAPAAKQETLKPWGFHQQKESHSDGPVFYAYNGRKAILAETGDNVGSLAKKGNVTTDELRRYNDLRDGDRIQPGAIYYLRKKWKRAKTPVYVTQQPDETLWSVAQGHGVRLEALLQKNRMDDGYRPLPPGTEVYLRRKKPKNDRNFLVRAFGRKAPPPPRTAPAPPRREKIEEAPVPDVEAGTPVFEAPAATPEFVEEVATFEYEDPAVGTTAPPPSRREKTIVIRSTPMSEGPTDDTTPAGEAVLDPVAEEFPAEAVEIGTTAPPPTATILPPAADPDALGGHIHVVAAGETLYAIARRYDTSVDSLRAWNELGSSALSVGRTLRFRPLANPAARTHRVAPGETLYAIARRYGVTIKALLARNGKADAQLAVGEELVIP